MLDSYLNMCGPIAAALIAQGKFKTPAEVAEQTNLYAEAIVNTQGERFIQDLKSDLEVSILNFLKSEPNPIEELSKITPETLDDLKDRIENDEIVDPPESEPDKNEPMIH